MARLVAVVCLLTVLLRVAAAGLTWPKAYTVSGNVQLPYGDIEEPFVAWVDMSSGKSRLDTYSGTGSWLGSGCLLPCPVSSLEYQPDLLLCSVVLSCLEHGGKGVAWAESNGAKDCVLVVYRRSQSDFLQGA